MGNNQPFMYEAAARNDARFPTSQFDPKAFTRASWEPKPERPQQNGPLVTFNRHPDAHEFMAPRNEFKALGQKTKGSVKWLRRFQLFLRFLELNGGLGILVLMILFTKVPSAAGWIMRIVPGVSMAHSVYGIYHHSRSATGRPPASTAAYQLFSGVTDLAIVSLYAYGAFTIHKDATNWSTRLNNKDLLEYLVPACYWTVVGTGALHVVSMLVALWLCRVFQKIAQMPPDMNPLEDNLTARPFHKRNKSSLTTSTVEDEKRLSTPHSSRYRSGVSYESLPSPNTIPFMHTRTNSRGTLASRDSQLNLPQRQYQIAASNSPRNSAASVISSRMSVPRASTRGGYTEISLKDVNSSRGELVPSNGAPRDRAPKFTETWMPTDSLISRTNQRNREMVATETGRQAHSSQSYSALGGRYNADDSESDYGDDEVPDAGSRRNDEHPNPLRSHPTAVSQVSSSSSNKYQSKHVLQHMDHPAFINHQRWTASKLSANSALSEISHNGRTAPESKGLADRSLWDNKPDLRPDGKSEAGSFYSRPYGELKSATPPVIIGNNSRKISSGNDYRQSSPGGVDRRRVSGKVAEEGLAGSRFTIGYAR